MVDIIIPFYNAEATLEQTLASVEAQTFDNWRVIFIDDGSTDSSLKIAQSFLQRNSGKGKIIESLQARSGPAVGRNQALHNADGLYIICLDSDDLLAPFCLEQRVSVMQKNPNLDWAVFNQYQCSPGEEAPYKLFNLPAKTREEAIVYFLKMDTAWQTMAPIWKRETLLKLQGFDKTLYPSEDPDIHLRALLDTAFSMEIWSDLPADCYYFVANKSEEKILSFYRDSIKSKFRFIKKTLEYLPGQVSEQTLKTYRKYIRNGYFHFIKIFLLSRLKEHNQEFKETTLLLFKSGILSSTDILYIKFITAIFSSNSLIIKKLRIRGFTYRLLLKNS